MKYQIEISEIQIVPVKPNSGLIGFCSFLLNEQFYVGNVAIFTMKNGLGIRLIYPKKHDVDCFHPIKREAGDYITHAIQKKFKQLWPDYFF